MTACWFRPIHAPHMPIRAHAAVVADKTSAKIYTCFARKTAFVMQNFQNLGDIGGGGEIIYLFIYHVLTFINIHSRYEFCKFQIGNPLHAF